MSDPKINSEASGGRFGASEGGEAVESPTKRSGGVLGRWDLRVCPVPVNHAHLWSEPDASGIRECLWCYLRAGPVEAESLAPRTPGHSDAIAHFTRTDPGQSLPGECVHSYVHDGGKCLDDYHCPHCGRQFVFRD